MSNAFDVVIEFIVGLARGNPLLGVFLASILGNVIPFFPVPYLLVVVFVATTFGGLSLVQVATIGALGAAMGKFVSYLLGYQAGRAFPGSRGRFDSLRKFLGGSAFLAAFLFAASPFPDDVIFIPLGIMRYSPLKTFLSLFTGKFVLTLFVGFVARSSSGLIDLVLGGGLLASLLSIGVVVLVAILMMRIDWEKILTQRQNGILRRLKRRITRFFRGSSYSRSSAEGKSSTNPEVQSS